MIDPTQPATSVTLSDPNGDATPAQDAAIHAVLQESMQEWASHLVGLGTLTVQLNVTTSGFSGSNVLADCSPTVDLIEGPLDGKMLIAPDTYYELSNGYHFNSGQADITINLDANYLSEFYTGLDGNPPSNEYDLQTVLLHEIERGLGFGGETSQTGTNGTPYETMWDHYLTPMNGGVYFTGANAEAVDGGPVAVTTLSDGEGYSCISNGGDANADDLMSGLGLPTGTVRGISDIDLAILADVGAPISGIAGTVTIGAASDVAAPGVAKTLPTISLADTGAFTSSTVTATLTDATGQLTAAAGNGAIIQAHGNTLAISGSLAEVQGVLATVTYTCAGAGAEVVQVAVVDSYGNSGSSSLTMTSVGPTGIPATPDAAGPLAAGHSVTFTLSMNAPVTVGGPGTPSLSLSDGGTATYDAAASTSTALVFTTTVLAGQNSADLGVTGLALGPDGTTLADADGDALVPSVTLATPGSASGIVVDTAAPLAPTLFLSPSGDSGLSQGDGMTNVAGPTFIGSAEANSQVVVSDTVAGITRVVGTATTTTSGTWTLTAGSPLPDGASLVTATATDAAGNVSAPSAVLSLTLDTAAPAAPTLTTAPTADTPARPRPAPRSPSMTTGRRTGRARPRATAPGPSPWAPSWRSGSTRSPRR